MYAHAVVLERPMIMYHLCIYELHRGYVIKIQGRLCPVFQLKLKMCQIADFVSFGNVFKTKQITLPLLFYFQLIILVTK